MSFCLLADESVEDGIKRIVKYIKGDRLLFPRCDHMQRCDTRC
jgi:hypothetical protein